MTDQIRDAARRKRSLWVLLLLLGVLVTIVVLQVGWLGAASGASAPPAPTITSGPVNPTAATGATFVFSAPPSGGSNQCKVDSGTFTNCTSPKTYPSGSFGGGSHTFQVQAVAGGKTSSATSYTWVIDTTPPSVSSIVRVGASPTNAVSVQWTVTFSEPVSGVDATDFALVKVGVAGGSAAVTMSGSGASYTATMASTGSGDGTIGLNLVDDDTIIDSVGNRLGGVGAGNGSFTGQVFTIDKSGPLNAPTITSGPSGQVASTSASLAFGSSEAGVAGFQCQLDSGGFASCSSPKSYSGLSQGLRTFKVRAVDALGNPGPEATRAWTVDTVAPPAPVLTSMPDDPNGAAISSFEWTDGEAGVTFECSIENGPYGSCTSPLTFTVIVDTNSNQQHQFAVRAVDAALNRSGPATYKWKVDKGIGFTITGDAPGLLYPLPLAFPPLRLNLTITNPNNFAIKVTSLTVTVQSVAKAAGAPAGPCTANDYKVTDYSGPGFIAPPGTSTLSADGVPISQRPSIGMYDRQDSVPGNGDGNQDGCQHATVKLTYSGTATK